MNKKIVLISEYELHRAEGAAFERMRCYAKTLSGFDIYCVDANSGKRGSFVPLSDVGNLYAEQIERTKNSYLYRNLFRYFDFITPLRLCRDIKRNYPAGDTTLLLYSSSFPLFFVVVAYLKFLHQYRLVIEKNELEVGIVLNSHFPPGLASIFFFLLYPYRLITAHWIDRMTRYGTFVIAISSKIKKRYSRHTQVEQIPILVDLDRFDQLNGQPKANGATKVIFLGAITAKKDGLGTLLHSLKELAPENSHLQIDLFGAGNRHVVRGIKKYIQDNGLDQTVFLKGYVPGKDVPALLPTYDFSLLLRTSNLQTENGFSTKLGEYLAAGVPVLYTGVSDNDRYLQDGRHGFRVEFPVEAHLRETLEKVLNTSEAQRVSMRVEGRKLAQSSFSYRNYVEQLTKIFA